MSATAEQTALPAAAERRTSAVELLWDLVFVFAVTQVSTLLAHDLSWAGVGRATLVLALVWWAWSAFVWAANAQAADSPVLRGALVLALVLVFVTGLAVPRAFAGEATLFAIAYAGVRALHLAVYADASRRGSAEWRAIAGFALTVAIGMALLIGGSFASGALRAALWTAAAAVDYAGPAWLTRDRLRSLQRVAVAHFSERYGLFVIICLGESVAAIGLGAAGRSLSAALLVTGACGLLTTVGLWWAYFDRLATVAERRLRAHRDPVIAAADAYSYLHLPVVAGIIVFAVGMRFAVQAPGAPLTAGARAALCGGAALYLLALSGFGLRIAGEAGWPRIVAAGALAVLFAAGGGLSAWALTASATAVVAALCAAEVVASRAETTARFPP